MHCNLPNANSSHDLPAAMAWGDGDNWTLEADMLGGCYDFKFVVVREGATADDSEWEAGANRSLFVSIDVSSS